MNALIVVFLLLNNFSIQVVGLILIFCAKDLILLKIRDILPWIVFALTLTHLLLFLPAFKIVSLSRTILRFCSDSFFWRGLAYVLPSYIFSKTEVCVSETKTYKTLIANGSCLDRI
ncbi:hypothetical protein [Leptospira weilii]|uniref:hypothetical protein n=1 Tax=Leptospira weilii TaxID=28184 RepID=UPI000B25773A|nr:hypothetical protein [Leptospira weilii]